MGCRIQDHRHPIHAWSKAAARKKERKKALYDNDAFALAVASVLHKIILVALKRHTLPLRLVDSHEPEEVIFQGHQVQQQAVPFPSKPANHSTRYRIEKEMVRGGYNGNQNDCWICDSKDEAKEAARGRNTHA